ncbi:MAG: enoyl-CoA hydratase-related protein [Pseudomonadota bacterium]|nr:enoyl-CoA hydratase-related protein [Pseudomonadota bacterium]
MSNYKSIIVDLPAEKISRITLNRPKQRNSLSANLRSELFQTLEENDMNPEISVTIIRGSGKAFSAGYDLKRSREESDPYYTAGGLSYWPRHVVEGCFKIWDLAKPVIAQVHGYCLAGGTELAQSCDLVYVAEDATIGYPVVRNISPPDNQFFPWIVGMRKAMELMLTGNSISGKEAADYGFANSAFPADILEEKTLEIAKNVAEVPQDVQQFNKRAVHRQMELMGIRAALKAGTEIQQLSMHTKSARDFFKKVSEDGLTEALSERDSKYGDYREKKTEKD